MRLADLLRKVPTAFTLADRLFRLRDRFASMPAPARHRARLRMEACEAREQPNDMFGLGSLPVLGGRAAAAPALLATWVGESAFAVDVRPAASGVYPDTAATESSPAATALVSPSPAPAESTARASQAAAVPTWDPVARRWDDNAFAGPATTGFSIPGGLPAGSAGVKEEGANPSRPSATDVIPGPVTATAGSTAPAPAALPPTVPPAITPSAAPGGGAPVTNGVPPPIARNFVAPNYVPELGASAVGVVRSAAGAAGGDPAAAGFSAAGVRYTDGTVSLTRTDLSSAGFGTPWEQGGAWNNFVAGTGSRDANGDGWMGPQLPYLQNPNGDNSTVITVSSGTDGRYFDLSGSVYVERQFLLDSLVHSGTQFTLTDTDGNKTVFNDFSTSVPAAEQGQFASLTDRYGTVTSITSYTSGGLPAEVRRTATVSGTTYTESYQYTYLTSGVNAGLLQSVVLRRSTDGGMTWATVRQVQYAYYDGTTSYGNQGDLQTATLKDPAGNTIGTSYYRYYTSADLGTVGYVHGMKYAFSPRAYAQLVAAVGNPLTATDAQVSPYADRAFQYVQSTSQVKQVVVGGAGGDTTGGQGTYTYAITQSSNTAGYNSWYTKTVETLPDGNTNTVYENAYSEVMLKVYKDTGSGSTWDTFTEYDSSGRVILQAQPSAVTGYNDTYADLLHNVSGSYQYLSSTSGLITAYDYYTSTTAGATTAGGVAGYEQDMKVRQGQSGTAITRTGTQYYSVTAGGVTIAPVATSTAYRNTDGTGGETTSYAYTFFTGTTQIQSQAVTGPTVPAGENGPGTAATVTTYFDAYRRPVWTKDAGGFISYTQYDPATGAVVKTIADVNTADSGDFTGLPSGWTTPTGGGLELITTTQVDALGRPTKVTGPGGNVTYTVYLDSAHEQLIYPGWNTSTNAPTGPTQVSRQDWTNGYDETFTMSATPHLTGGVPDGTEAVSGLQTLSRAYLNAARQVTSQYAYFNLSGITYGTGVLGTAGTNFYQTTVGFDARGRQARVVSPTGTITRTVYDGRGRKVSEWVGTNDTPGSGAWSPTNNTSPSNMIDVTDYQYDGGSVGDDTLTKVTTHPGAGAADRVTQAWYDWRDRAVAVKQGVSGTETDGAHRPITYTTYDNLDEATEVQRYDGDGVTITVTGGVPVAPSASLLRAQTVTSYDEQGRVYQQQQYDVNPSTGAVSSTALATNTYYDLRGNAVAVSAPGGPWTKTQYDGAGRPTYGYTTDGAGGTGYTAATGVSSDDVLTQTQTVYDGDSNPIETIARDRFDTATGTGALGTPTTGVAARESYQATYFDAADRKTADVNVGTNGGSAWTRPTTAPAASATVLTTTYGYNAAGWVQDVTDPLGHVTRTLYDALDRPTKVTQNYTGAAETTTADVATEYTYDGAGHTLTVKADEPGGSSETTQFVYGVTTAGGSGVNSNDLLATTQYPDPGTGAPSSTSKDTQTVNALGQVLTKTDRNGTVHTDTYDVLGRQTVDAVTTLGTGVDGGVRRIETAYDGQGNPYLVTSYTAASGGGVVNQVQRAYDGLAQLTTEYQATTGAVSTLTSPKVQYAYVDLAGGANNSRPTGVTYPSGYALSYTYGSGLDTTVSRLTSIADTGNTLEGYTYLGAGTVVQRAHSQPGVNLTYISQTGGTGDAGDKYVGLDRFGRVVDQNWYSPSTSSSVEDVQYGYDAAGNVLWRNDPVSPSSSFGELYTYDGLNQLATFQRGTLNGTKTGLTGTASASQSWTPDALGNFTGVTTNGTAQARTANQQNEVTAVSGATTPAYSAAGEMTTDETGKQYVYDAWGRVVTVKSSGGTTLETLTYDGLNRQVTSTASGTTTTYYYSDKGQVVEEWQGGAVQARNVWSPVYVNALIVRDQSSLHNGTLDQRLYAVQDANWNVTALVNASGTVAERYAYLPYGAVTVLNPSTWATVSGSSYGAVYLFQGMRQDVASRFYETTNRWYSPTFGEWTRNDPKGFEAGDSNWYRFVEGSPEQRTDPAGFSWLSRQWDDVVMISNYIGRGLNPGAEDYSQPIPTKEADGDNLPGGLSAGSTIPRDSKIWGRKAEAEFVPQAAAGAGTVAMALPFIPGNPFRGVNAAKKAYQHLRRYHGIEPVVAGNRLHKLKDAAGLGAADNVVIGRTGDVYIEKTGQRIGSLTDASLGK